MRRFAGKFRFHGLALAAAFGLVIGACEMRSGEEKLPEPGKAEGLPRYQLQALPQVAFPKGPGDLNRYVVNIKRNSALSTRVRIDRLELGAAGGPIPVAALATNQANTSDPTVHANHTYVYTLTEFSPDNPSQKIRQEKIGVSIPKDLYYAKNSEDPFKDSRTLTIGRFYLASSAHLVTEGKELVIEADELIAEPGASISVFNKGKESLVARDGVKGISIRCKRAIGALEANLKYPLPHSLNGTSGVPEVDPDDFQRSSQKFDLLISEESPFTLSLRSGFASLREAIQREFAAARASSFRFRNGSKRFRPVEGTLIDEAEVSGLYEPSVRGTMSPFDQYVVILPGTDVLYMLLDFLDTRGAKEEFGTIENGINASLLSSKLKAGQLDARPPADPSNNKIFPLFRRLTPGKSARPWANCLSEVLERVRRIDDKLSEKGLEFTLGLGTNPAGTSHVCGKSQRDLIEGLETQAAALSGFMQHHKIHRAVFELSRENGPLYLHADRLNIPGHLNIAPSDLAQMLGNKSLPVAPVPADRIETMNW